jgi:anti-anti-sigma regulatory factor
MAATSIPFTDTDGRLAAMAYPAGDATVIAPLDRGHRNVVLDLHELRSLDPEALGLLWAALRSVRRRGGSLVAARARPELRPALQVLGSGGLAVHETVRAALSDAEDR